QKMADDLLVLAEEADGELHDQLLAASAEIGTTINGTLQPGRGVFEQPGLADLQSILTSLQGVAALLPDSGFVAGISEDAPIHFDVEEMPGQLESVASRSESGNRSLEYVSTLIMRIRMMLTDGRLQALVAPTHGPDIDAWIEQYLGDGSD